MIETVLADLPTTIHSFVRLDDVDDYTIILNSRLNRESIMKAYMHELQHINNGDYEKKCNADLIEFVAHIMERG